MIVPKLSRLILTQVNDDNSIIVEDERTYNWTMECNSCHKIKYFNHQVRNARTKRLLLMEQEYHPGITPVQHKCMFKGQGYWINKYDGSLQWAKDVTPNVDKVDARTKEIAVKRWRQKVGYQPLDEYEKEQIEFGRKYYNGFYNKKHSQ